MRANKLTAELSGRWLQYNAESYRKARSGSRGYYADIAGYYSARLINVQTPRLAFQAGAGSRMFPQMKQPRTTDEHFYSDYFPSLMSTLIYLNGFFRPTTDNPLRVLEVGCGTGVSSLDLALTAQEAKIPTKVTGVDIRPGEMDCYLGLHHKIPPALRAEFKRADEEIRRTSELGIISLVAQIAEDLPPEWTNYFHLVISVRSFCYMDDQIGALEEVSRVIKPGGRALLQIYFGTEVDMLGGLVNTLQRFAPLQGFKINWSISERWLELDKQGENQIITGLVRNRATRYRVLPFPQGRKWGINDYAGIVPERDNFNPALLTAEPQLTLFDLGCLF